MAAGRRAFLRTGAAAAAAAALGPAPLSAQGKGPIRLAYLQLGWAATEIIHKEDLLGKRGWQAEYSIVPGAPGPLLNQLASKNVDAIDMSFALAAKAFEDGVPLKVTGVATAVLGAIVARKATGRPTGFPVHVCYLVHGEFLQKHPTIARDLNDAQKDAVEVWYNKPARAMEIVQEVTKLPADVVQVAHRETVRMLYGLPDEQVDTLIAQLKINKEFGFLKSDIWDTPDRIRREFFHRA